MALFWIGGIPTPYQVPPPHVPGGVSRVARGAAAQKTDAHKGRADGDAVGEGTAGEGDAAGEAHAREVVRAYEEPPRRQRRPVVVGRELMRTGVHSLTETHTTDDARRLFRTHKLHHVPIVDDAAHLVGIVSEHDLMQAQIAHGAAPQPLGEIMTRKVLAAAPDTPIREIAGTMAAEHIHAVPIVDDGRLAGMITAGDILGCLVHRAPLDLWL